MNSDLNIVMSRRASETYEKINPLGYKPTNLEKNCKPIFNKGPHFAREIFDKMQKNKTYILGHNVDSKHFWIFSGLFLLFALSFAGTISMWFTDMFDNAVFANMAIVENSESYKLWQKPSPKPLLNVYIFNYTNVAEFETRTADKLNVQELGPFVYEVTLGRVHAKFNGSKVTYQEQRHYKFMPDLSKGHKQNDKVVVPNIPLLTAAAVNKHANFLTRVGLSGLLNSLNAKAFLTLPAHRFIVGYEDSLYALSKSYLKFQNKNPYERFGLVSSSIGIPDDVMTINTGVNDINKIGLIDKFNGKSSLDHWSTEECNDINSATDGAYFSPRLVRNKKPINFYNKDMCRALPLEFKKEVKILQGKIPAYRYSLPYNVFDSPENTPSNQCFCNLDLGECPRQGIFNTTPCAFGAPLFLSFPHFYNADPIFQEAVTGLNPTQKSETYESYFDLHPTLGFTMAGKSRLQLNIQVAKAFGINQVTMFDDGLMLPVAWFDYTLEDKTLPEDMVGIIFQTTFTLRSIELGLKYGCLLTTIVTLIGLILVLKSRWSNRQRTSSIRPLQTSQREVV